MGVSGELQMYSTCINQLMRQDKAKQIRLKTTPLETMSCLRRDSNSQCSAYYMYVDALPTEPPRQLSWAGQIFEVYTRLLLVHVHTCTCTSSSQGS